MAQVKAKGAAKAEGNIRRIIIEKKANGFAVSCEREPKKGRDGMPTWEPLRAKDEMVFTQPGDTLKHVEALLGAKEHAAHEKAEGEHGGY